ncbi:MAG: succinate--CoA ligase [Deltaproteobacteria bacterium]|nr:succinate--CoA ligase [Deltaproteobacteria bacterium]
MRLLEHEAKQILKKHAIPVPEGEAFAAGQEITFPPPAVLKAQVPIGGRGKAGGILIADTPEEMGKHFEHLLATPIRGYTAAKILVEQAVEISREFYLAITYDTAVKLPVAIFSQQGGVDIEALAQEQPDAVVQMHFSPLRRFPSFMGRELVSRAGVSGKLLIQLGGLFARLAEVFLDYDATLAEINPLGLTTQGRLVALDCHLDVDDDALPRQPEIAPIEKEQGRFSGGREVSEFERRAQEIDNMDHRGVAGRVIEFPGNLGLIIGGGGASLTAFDAVRQHGGQPANYCEIGGNPSVFKVTELTKHILSKPGVKKIAVIMNVVSNTRVDLVARGVIKGILESGLDPADTVAVFRVPGAWEEEGFRLLDKYGVPYCDRKVSIDQAAQRAVSSAEVA